MKLQGFFILIASYIKIHPISYFSKSIENTINAI